MKNLYVCEYCGKTYTDYDEAWQCERNHVSVETLNSWDLPSMSDMQTSFYTNGEQLPEYVVFKANLRDADGNWEARDMPNGQRAFTYRAVVYKRVDKVKLPNGMTPDDYTDAMLRKQIADNPKEDETEEDEG